MKFYNRSASAEAAPYSADTSAEYDRLSRHMENFSWYKDGGILELINNKVPATSRRGLDIGCGTGIVLQYLAEKNRDVEWVGIDESVEMVVASKKKSHSKENVTVFHRQWLSIDEIGKTGKFDFVLIKNVLHLVNDVPYHLSLLSPYLTSTGRILIVETVSPDKEAKRFVFNLACILDIVGIKKHFFSSRELLRSVRTSDFEVQSFRYYDQFIDVADWIDAKARTVELATNASNYIEEMMQNTKLRLSMKYSEPGGTASGRMLRRQMLIQCVPRFSNVADTGTVACETTDGKQAPAMV